MMRRLVTVATAALLLAACGSKEEAGGNSTASTALEPTPGNLTDDPQNSVVPVGNGTALVPDPKASPVARMPAAFRGRWGMTPNDCDPTRADNKGLLTVTADRLTFYESRALPRDLMLAGTTLTGTLDFTGEGQRWQAPAYFTLVDDGRTLVRDNSDEGTTRYARCP